MRTLTTIVREHPHNKLKSFLQSMKKEYQSLSTSTLDMFYTNRLAEHPDEDDAGPYRHQRVERLLKWDEAAFKRQWHETNGWPFDDTYDPALLRFHVMEDSIKQKRFQMEARIAQLKENLNDLSARMAAGTGLSIEETAKMNSIEEDLPLLEKELRGIEDELAALQAKRGGKPEERLPDGCEKEDGAIGPWQPHTMGQYDKKWAQVKLKDGSTDLEWRWPNAGFFGPHPEDTVAEVRYFTWHEDKNESS